MKLEEGKKCEFESVLLLLIYSVLACCWPTREKKEGEVSWLIEQVKLVHFYARAETPFLFKLYLDKARASFETKLSVGSLSHIAILLALSAFCFPSR